MTISVARARKLCTASEFELVHASTASNARALSPQQLKQRAVRTRKLRDKYRDLARRQRLEARGKRRSSGNRPAQGQENTVRKAELFQETLERFEKHLDRAQRSGAASGRRAGASKAAGVGQSAGARKSASARKSTGTKKAAGAKKATGTKQAAGTRNAVGTRKSAGTAKSAGARKSIGAGKSAATRKSSGAKKSAAAGKAAGAKPAGGKGGRRKAVAKKAAQAKQLARAAEPGKAGASAMKGARTRPSANAPHDRKQQAAQRKVQSHVRTSGRRNQSKRDRR